MSYGRIILLVTLGFTMLLFFIDLFIIIYEKERYLYEEYKRYERRELKRLVKEWHEENKLARIGDDRPSKPKKRGGKK